MKRRIPVQLATQCLGRLTEGDADPPDTMVKDALESCEVLRIPFQTVVVGTPPAEPRLAKADEALLALRRTDMGLAKVEAAMEVAEHSRNLGNPVGGRASLCSGECWQMARWLSVFADHRSP